MNPLLRDLYGHQAWADAEHWRAIAALPAAGTDLAIRSRLHHIHLVQRMFLWAVADRTAPPKRTAAGDFATLADLKAYGREYHAQVDAFLHAAPAARFDEKIAMPWFPDPPLTGMSQ